MQTLDRERFEAAVEKVLAHEGGYVNDPDDPGGETNFGISKRTYPNFHIRSLTRDQAKEIYYRDWWQFYGYGMIANDAIAAKVFDLAVNMGASRAHKLLQKAVNKTSPSGLAVDGKLGMLSLAAINDHPYAEHLLDALKLTAVEYYLGLNKSKYLAGWVRRALS
jgi:lysozyme family protein